MDEEAARLLEALRDWAGGHAGEAEECRYCPLCRAIAAVRHTSPEVLLHLTAAATELGHALAAALSPPAPADRQEDR